MYINNHVISLGISKVDELRTAGGTSVLSFNGANQSPRKDGTTTWYRVSLWGKQAETLATMLEKGSQVVVVGETHNKPWKDKEGNERYSLEINVNTVQLQSKRGDREEIDVDGTAETVDDGGLF